MKLWLISQEKNMEYDTYDSAVVAAETEAEARLIHPNGHDWDGKATAYDSWTASEFVKVEYIGVAKDGTKSGPICASFNAG